MSDKGISNTALPRAQDSFPGSIPRNSHDVMVALLQLRRRSCKLLMIDGVSFISVASTYSLRAFFGEM
jgi:hypothetical protein